ERRGGRKPGTPNKKTLLKDAVFLAAAAEPNRSPLDFMLALMRDSQVPLEDRIAMAAACAPLVHARPRASGRSRPHPIELRAPAGKTAALGNPEEPSLPGEAEKLSLAGGHEAEIAKGPENISMLKAAEREATLISGMSAAGKGGDFKASDLPLDFLLGVM